MPNFHAFFVYPSFSKIYDCFFDEPSGRAERVFFIILPIIFLIVTKPNPPIFI